MNFNLFRYGTNDLFSFVSIETTTECNRRCPYCPNSRFDRSLAENKKLLDDKLFYKLVDELARLKYGGFFSPALYGEPLLDERIVRFMRYARSKLPLASIRIFTNGDFLTLDMYRSLVKAGVSVLSITKHSENDPAGINDILCFRKKHGDDDVFLSYEKLQQAWNRAGLVESGEAVDSEYCRMSMPELAIDCDGNVIICCNDYFSSVKLGNIREEKVMDIWKKKNFARLRKNIRKGALELDICKRCMGVKDKKA